jgi:hypothetical protein
MTETMRKFYRSDGVLIPTFSDFLNSNEAGIGTAAGLYDDYRVWRAAKIKAARRRGLHPIFQPACRAERDVTR